MKEITSSQPNEILIERDKNFNGIVKIDNTLLDGDFPVFTKGWDSFDLDWWNIVDSQAIDNRDNIIKIPIMQMKDLVMRKHLSNHQFIKRSNETFKKFLTLQVSIEQEENGKLTYMNSNLFDTSYIDSDYTAWIKVKDNAVSYFNNLSTWTRFALEQATKLHTTYSKRLFMYLKKWRTVGRVTFTMDEFRHKLDVPKSYRPGSIDQKILNPVAEDVAPYFFDFRITKNYAKGKRGRRLIGYTFSFKPERNNQNDLGFAKAVEETARIYSIMSNTYLTPQQRFRAVDRYRGLKFGTTEEYYKSSHPHTYFLDPDDKKRVKRSVLNRSDLGSLSNYSISILNNLTQIYEDLLHQGKLKEWDIEDLHLIEIKLFDKQVQLFLKTKKTENPYIPNTKFIATQVFKELNDRGLIESNEYKAESISEEIKMRVNLEFGMFAQKEDKRNLEFKIDMKHKGIN